MRELQSYLSDKGLIKVGQIIQVKSGDCLRKFLDAEIVGIIQYDRIDEEGNEWVETNMCVRYLGKESGCTQYVGDIDGWNKNEWRLKA